MSYITNKFDDKIIHLLKEGAVGFMPSDTIYGLSCRALDEQAVERLHSIKQRDINKPFIILISSTRQLDFLGIKKDLTNPVFKYWPGPLSIIMPTNSSPKWLDRGKKSLAVRLPDDRQLLNLIAKTGPIISTSANYQNDPPVNTCQEAQELFGEDLDFYVDAGELKSLPSTIVKVDGDSVTILREGAAKIVI